MGRKYDTDEAEEYHLFATKQGKCNSNTTKKTENSVKANKAGSIYAPGKYNKAIIQSAPIPTPNKSVTSQMDSKFGNFSKSNLNELHKAKSK
jgi:hypothetical protein